MTRPPPLRAKLESRGPTNVWLFACVVRAVAKSEAFSFASRLVTRFWYVMPSDCPVLLRVIRLFPDMLVTLLMKPDTSGIAPVFALVARTDRSPVVSTVRELPLLPSATSFGLFGSLLSLVMLLM